MGKSGQMQRRNLFPYNWREAVIGWLIKSAPTNHQNAFFLTEQISPKVDLIVFATRKGGIILNKLS